MRKFWPSAIIDSIKGIKAKKDCTGIIFDLSEDTFERFIDIFENLKEKNS